MELSKPTRGADTAPEILGKGVSPEQLARRQRAVELMAAIAAGEVTRPEQLDPRETSPEVVHIARLKLVELGHIARKKITSGL